MIDATALTIAEEAKALDAWKELTADALAPLLTKAQTIRASVRAMIAGFTVDAYYDDPEATKRDRAALNNAATYLNDNRKAVERAYLEPFDPVKAEIAAAVNDIKFAAGKLDEIDKANEETRRNEKRRDIEQYFNIGGFNLVPFDRLFDQRWTNKTAKMSDVKAELDAKIAGIYENLKLLEGYGDNAESLKALYLDSLDIGDAMRQALALKANRERVEREKAERAQREHAEKIEAQAVDLAVDAEAERKADQVASVVAEALEVEKDPIMTVTLRFRGTRAQLLALRQYMTSLGVEYDKLAEDAV